MSTPTLSPDISALSQVAEMKRIFMAVENGLKNSPNPVLVVTSPVRGEGKTMTAAALAVLSARSGQSVLAVDLHWHRPGLHACFGLSPNTDSSVLLSSENPRELAQETSEPNLSLLAAPGDDSAKAINASVGLDSGFLGKISPGFDRVIVDMAPIFPTNRYMMDPVAASRAAGGAVMVVGLGTTPRSQAKRAAYMLKTSGAPLFGVILNSAANSVAHATGVRA